MTGCSLRSARSPPPSRPGGRRIPGLSAAPAAPTPASRHRSPKVQFLRNSGEGAGGRERASAAAATALRRRRPLPGCPVWSCRTWSKRTRRGPASPPPSPPVGRKSWERRSGRLHSARGRRGAPGATPQPFHPAQVDLNGAAAGPLRSLVRNAATLQSRPRVPTRKRLPRLARFAHILPQRRRLLRPEQRLTTRNKQKNHQPKTNPCPRRGQLLRARQVVAARGSPARSLRALESAPPGRCPPPPRARLPPRRGHCFSPKLG